MRLPTFSASPFFRVIFPTVFFENTSCPVDSFWNQRMASSRDSSFETVSWSLRFVDLYACAAFSSATTLSRVVLRISPVTPARASTLFLAVTFTPTPSSAESSSDTFLTSARDFSASGCALSSWAALPAAETFRRFEVCSWRALCRSMVLSWTGVDFSVRRAIFPPMYVMP